MIKPADSDNPLLEDPHFVELKDWLIQKTGLSYYEDKDRALASAISRSYGGRMPFAARAVLRRLKESGHDDLDRIVEELTIGETFFFRHLEMFNALRNVVFADLIRRKQTSRFIRIWSAGCSIGAEPYSIAILLREMLGAEYDKWHIEIVGTDINRRFLQIAKTGAYDPWALRGLSEDVLKRCFTKQDNKWVLRESCKNGVRFKYHNMAEDPFPNPETDLCNFDLLICRNVMIYFDLPTIQRLVKQFHATIVPGGWLAVGHAEPHTQTFREFRTINAPGAVLYQRHLGAPTEAFAKEENVWFEHPRSFFPVLPLVKSISTTSSSKKLPNVQTSPKPVLSKDVFLDANLEKISTLANAGDLELARESCVDLVTRDPLCVENHYYHGLILFNLNEWESARQAFKRCIYLQRDLAVVHYHLGLLPDDLSRTARHFQNALDIVAKLPDEEPLPLGDGLTAVELRALVELHLQEQG